MCIAKSSSHAVACLIASRLSVRPSVSYHTLDEVGRTVTAVVENDQQKVTDGGFAGRELSIKATYRVGRKSKLLC